MSIALALAVRDLPGRCMAITATDLGALRTRPVGIALILEKDSAICLMKENIHLNSLGVDPNGHLSVEARILDWTQPLPSWLGVDGSWPDLIM